MTLIKLPLTILERSTGQFFRRPLPEIYAIHHERYVGNAFVIVITFAIMGYFHFMLTIYCVMYVIDAMLNRLDWITGGNKDAVFMNLRNHFQNETLQLDKLGSSFLDFNTRVTPVYLIMWVVVYYCMREGIRSNEALRSFLVVSIYGALIVMLLKVLLLPGSIDGIRYLIIPRFDKVFNMTTWKEALDQNYFQGILEHTQYLAAAVFKRKSSKVFKSTCLYVKQYPLRRTGSLRYDQCYYLCLSRLL